MEITTPEAATPLDVAHGEEFVAATSAPAESPAPARAAIASSTGLRTLANAAAAAAMAAHPRDRSRARQTSQPFAPSAADAVVPGGVKIGRIDVTVLADAPPAQPAAPAAERNFLSRHYLRRP